MLGRRSERERPATTGLRVRKKAGAWEPSALPQYSKENANRQEERQKGLLCEREKKFMIREGNRLFPQRDSATSPHGMHDASRRLTSRQQRLRTLVIFMFATVTIQQTGTGCDHCLSSKGGCYLHRMLGRRLYNVVQSSGHCLHIVLDCPCPIFQISHLLWK
jgi:hypothetical protein